ncbi:MAG: acyltransferase [Planctomycetota bacterium]|jgi:acetyltransferase-like isoleucine patch superfamily enzyme
MLDKKDKLQNKEDVEALKEWLKGEKIHPYILPRRNAYNICAVLFPTLFSRIKYHLSYFIMAIISKIPWSQVKVFLYRLMGVKIGKGVYIAPWVFLDGMYPQLIELEDGCFLGGGCKLLTHENTTDRFRIGRIRIGVNSVIGAFSIVRSGVTVGSNVTTGIGSIVLKDIPDDRAAIGNPARVVKASKKIIQN